MHLEIIYLLCLKGYDVCKYMIMNMKQQINEYFSNQHIRSQIGVPFFKI